MEEKEKKAKRETMNLERYPWLVDLESPAAKEALQQARRQYLDTGAGSYKNKHGWQEWWTSTECFVVVLQTHPTHLPALFSFFLSLFLCVCVCV